jgi:hypothetical protein
MRRVLATLICFALATAAQASFVTGFEASEGYSGSASGISIAGQQGWYIPSISGTVPAKVFTYAGNPYGIPNNPYGGAQFLNGLSEGGSAFARAQKDYDWSSETTVTVSFDMCVRYTVVTPATDNIGSWSLQDTATATYMQSLYTWVDYTNPAAFRAGYFTNEVPAAPGIFPGPEWQNLFVDHWYRHTVTLDFTTWLIMECSIQDLTTGGPKTTVNPEGWHFIRYTTPIMPTAFRFFTGGSTAGNLTAWDNLAIGPPPSPSPPSPPPGTPLSKQQLMPLSMETR